MNLFSCISQGSKVYLVVVKNFMLFTKCGEDGCECARKKFVDGVGECEGEGKLGCER